MDTTSKKTKIVFLLLSFFFVSSAYSIAGQVTIAAYDFDEDSFDEIIRTDEYEGLTNIRVYKRIEDSYFYAPFQQFKVSGRLVQVPEIMDVNKDGMKDYFFATGTDMGVLYFDVIKGKFNYTNDLNFNAVLDTSSSQSLTSVDSQDSSSVDSQRETIQDASQSDFELKQLETIFEEDRSLDTFPKIKESYSTYAPISNDKLQKDDRDELSLRSQDASFM
jgi:hypothetical protein